MRLVIFVGIVVLTGTAGDICVTHAMKRIGEVTSFRPAVVLPMLGKAFRHASMWMGIALMAVRRLLQLRCGRQFRCGRVGLGPQRPQGRGEPFEVRVIGIGVLLSRPGFVLPFGSISILLFVARGRFRPAIVRIGTMFRFVLPADRGRILDILPGVLVRTLRHQRGMRVLAMERWRRWRFFAEICRPMVC